MSESLPKRRKTKGAFTLIKKPKMAVTWPQNEVPVEIFVIIVSFLSRSNVQSMRLVNKEFEQKVSQFLFKTVVVPFRPEIYGITEDSSLGTRGSTNNHDQQPPPDKLAMVLQDKGMRVFQGFGRHIHRFAMSFEFDYDLLTKPPLKSDQRAVTTFWGIYRWPYKGYHRYEALEGLEQTADETRTMAKALRFVGECKELGLSIDGGLGWLPGPDVNSKIQSANGDVVVFGASTFPPEEKSPTVAKSKSSKSLNWTGDSNSIEEEWASLQMDGQAIDEYGSCSALLRMLREAGYETGSSTAWLQMLHEAGYEGLDLVQSILTLRESEGMLETTTSNSSFDSSLGPSMSSSSSLILTNPIENSPHGRKLGILLEGIRQEGARLERLRLHLTREGNDRPLRGSSRSEGTSIAVQSPAIEPHVNLYPLKPNDLTIAQKEMLLETEWAQRAFTQSYAIAIIDNPSTFRNVKTLTIARLPSRHLSILKRSDFWSSLSNLETISLAIIPDWREVVKLPTSWVDDVRVQPSQAICGVYDLFKDHIAPNKSIATLHFEWLGGGEEATGIFARNQHILAAPLLPQAIDMVSRSPSARILNLPYVKHLSLKNCWISPQVLVKFGTKLKKQALQSFTLQSVSLTAPAGNNGTVPVLGQQLPPQAPNHVLNQGIQQLQAPFTTLNNPAGILQAGFQGLPAMNPLPTNPSDWLRQPRTGSWAKVIDSITPGNTLACMRFARDNIGEEPPAPKPTLLRSINFHSCGYVRLHLEFDQTMLDPPDGRQQGIENYTAASVSKRRVELEQFMMKTSDRTLGTIVNHLDEEESRTLQNAWNLVVGWGEAGKVLAAQAKADGVRNAGQGRFGGSIVIN